MAGVNAQIARSNGGLFQIVALLIAPGKPIP
jgi:hypothetical protein